MRHIDPNPRNGPAALQLSLCFDPARLKTDLALIHAEEWTPHYNQRDYGGDWRGVALRSSTCNADDLVAQPTVGEGFEDTPLLHRLSYFRHVLSLFQCPLKSARLLSLAPNSFIREHSDPGFGFEAGEIRVHIPVRVNSHTDFYLDGKRLQMGEGNCYCIDASRPHRARNSGTESRVHLVIDTVINDWLRRMLEQSQAVAHLPPEPMGFEEFCKLVMLSPELQRELHSFDEPNEFLDRTVRLGVERGFHFDRAEVEWHGTALRKMEAPHDEPGSGWLPIAVKLRGAEPSVEWAYFGTSGLTEPFFEFSIRTCLRNPFARAFRRQTPLLAWGGRAPSGFIFHLSRCGSTLIAQMLAALPRATVVSEAAPIDEVIQSRLRIPSLRNEEHVEWLRAIVGALGRGPAGQDLYFVKLDAWHIHKLPLLRAAFPDTPWVFMYRDPTEVLVSQLRCPGRFALPGAMDPSFLGMRYADITIPPDEWCARVLAGFCQSALDFRGDGMGMFLNYRQLPEAVWGTLSRHFSVSFDECDVARMRAAAFRDAKSPTRVFQADSMQKRAEASARMQELAARFLEPLYLQLENLAAAECQSGGRP